MQPFFTRYSLIVAEVEVVKPEPAKAHVEPKPKTETKESARKPEAVKQKPVSSMSTLAAQEEIGSLSSLVMGDPEHHLKDLAKLRSLAGHKSSYIKKLAYLAQLAVFKDIIPGYRIRKRSDKEENVKLSKEVDRVKRYEESLLQQYQNYLQQLEETIKGNLRLHCPY